MESVHHGVWSCGIVGIIQLCELMESTDEHNFRFTAFLCLLAGITCIMAQILVYIFLQESQAVKITMTCVIVITALPLLALVPISGSSDGRSSSKRSSHASNGSAHQIA